MKPRIAIACSGLGHVNRGSETWAACAAQALHEAGATVTLYGGGGNAGATCPYVRVPNWRRDNPATRSWLSWHQRYLLEQRTFACGFLRHLKRETFDLVHLTDPALAWIIQRGRGPWRVIYQDGLHLGPSWCGRFDAVQLLAPPALKEAEDSGAKTANWYAIPHMVDVRTFSPSTDRQGIRAKILGHSVPSNAPVILAVGDLSPGSNKRLNWIVSELARLGASHHSHLLVAGQASPGDCARFVHESKQLLGDRVHVMTNLPSSRMPEIYQAADIFAHAALREPFGIVFLEAMATGLPVIAHEFPVTQWIVGDGGKIVDMAAAGRLTAALDEWTRDERIRAGVGHRARERAISEFSRERIVPRYLEMYAQIHGRR